MEEVVKTNEVEVVQSANKDNAKPKTFRITDEVAQKIKDIAKELGGSQQEALSSMINAYELQAGKALLDDETRGNVEKFEEYVNALIRMYMTMVENVSNADDLAGKKYESQLVSKDKVILNLQEQLASRQDLLKEIEGEKNLLQSEHKIAFDKIKELEGILSDKEELIKVQKDTLENNKKEIANLGIQIADMQNEIKNVIEIQNELSRVKSELSDIKNELKAKELEYNQRNLELQMEHNNQMKLIQEEKIKEISKYQNMYESLLGNYKDLYTKIEQSKDKIGN